VASGIVMIATASEPTTATASGGLSSRIAGTTNSNTIAMLNTRPTSDRAPRRRANSRTIATKIAASTSIGPRRSKSLNV
jgi:hypothetical protein